jgi:hypothetical protein
VVTASQNYWGGAIPEMVGPSRGAAAQTDSLASVFLALGEIYHRAISRVAAGTDSLQLPSKERCLEQGA